MLIEMSIASKCSKPSTTQSPHPQVKSCQQMMQLHILGRAKIHAGKNTPPPKGV